MICRFNAIYLRKSEPVTVGLPCRKKSNIQRHTGSEALHDELYIITDKDALNETLEKIRDVLASYARKQHRLKQNGIALKDKSLSPKKVAVKRLASTCKLA